MTTIESSKKITRAKEKLRENGFSTPRNGLPNQHPTHKNHKKIRRNSLEEDAKRLSLWVIGKREKPPFNLSENPKRVYRIIKYLENHDYAYNTGQTPKEAMAHGYQFTPEGRKWVISK